MKKLFKLLRLKLGLYTRTELFDFAVNMVEEKKNKEDYTIWSSDVSNFIHDLKKQ